MGGLALAVLFASMFAGVYTGGQGAAWVCVAFLATATAFAFFQVPYVAMPAEMTEGIGLSDPYGERTRMMTWRVASLALTILVAGAVAPIVVEMFGQGIPGHRAMGIFIATLMVTGTIAVFVLTRGAAGGTVTESETRLRDQLRVARENKPFRVLVACFVAQAAGVATMLAGVRYFAQSVLHNESATSLLFVCVVSPAILVMPLWNRVGARIGKLKGYVAASLTLTIATFGLVAAPLLPTWAVYAVVGAIGVGYAGQQLFGLAMLPDCIAYDTARTGGARPASSPDCGRPARPSAWRWGRPSSRSPCSCSVTRPARRARPPRRPRRRELGVLLGFTVVPGVVVALALLFLRAYDLTADRLAGMAGPDTNLSDLRPS